MTATVYPGRLSGRIRAISSKAEAHRLIICAALCEDETELRISDMSQDIEATLSCVETMGAAVKSGGTSGAITLRSGETLNDTVLDCGESGSTLRFMLPVAAAAGKRISFTGRGRLPERPNGPLLDALRARGCVVEGDRLPLTVSGGLYPGVFTLPGNVSSQFVSGLLMALPTLPGDSEIRLTSPLESTGYVDMTVEVLRLFSIEVRRTETGYSVPGGQSFISPGAITVGGDWSNAAFWLTAGALGGPVEVSGLDAASAQGDREIAEILRRLGTHVEEIGGCFKASTDECVKLRGLTQSMENIPDLLPILSVAAAAAGGETRLTGAGRTRLKESDRIMSTARMLKALVADVKEEPDGLIIRGGALRGGIVDGANDHRIVMAAAVAATVCQAPVVIEGAEAVEKSYPRFFDDFRMLGGRADVK